MYQEKIPTEEKRKRLNTVKTSQNKTNFAISNMQQTSNNFNIGEIPTSAKKETAEISNWLLNKMDKNAKFMRMLSFTPPIISSTYFAYQMWPEHQWDFKHSGKTLGWKNNTVSISGFKVNYDVPGNIHYGYVGRAAGFPKKVLHLGADFAQGIPKINAKLKKIATYTKNKVHSGEYQVNLRDVLFLYSILPLLEKSMFKDDPKDSVAVDIGIDMWDKGTDLTSEIKKNYKQLNLDGTENHLSGK